MTINQSLAAQKLEDENRHFLNQKMKVYRFLSSGWFTASQVERYTGIRISNITIYKRQLEKSKLLVVGDSIKCPITGRQAKLITTNIDLVKVHIQRAFQPSLF